jgi:hypothetical protein
MQPFLQSIKGLPCSEHKRVARLPSTCHLHNKYLRMIAFLFNKPATALLLLAAPVTGLAGAVLWSLPGLDAVWPNVLWLSFLLFIPVGYRLAAVLQQRPPVLTAWALSLNMIGCVSAAGHMNLFRFNAVLPYQGSRNFPDILMQAMDQHAIDLLTYLPALLFPVSFVLFGIAVIKTKVFNILTGALLIVFGLLFWLGNAGESDAALISGYAVATVCFGLMLQQLRNV